MILLMVVLAFGFCEFEDQNSTLRALRILNNFNLGGKKLVIKVAAKSKPQFLLYIENKKRRNQGLSPLPELEEVDLIYYDTILTCSRCIISGVDLLKLGEVVIELGITSQ